MKGILIGVVLAALAIGGILLFSGDESVEETQSNAEVVEQEVAQVDEVEQVEPAEVATLESYVEYDEQSFEAAVDTHRVLFFHADWCPTCRAFEQVINNEEMPDDVTILKVDWDSSPDLIDEYGIPFQSYLAYVDANGDLVDSWYTLETETLKDVATRIGL